MGAVVFRRIRGHIVPLRVDRPAEARTGAALTVAGATVAAGSGFAFKKFAGQAMRNSVRGLRAAERVKFKPGKIGYQISFSQAARVNKVRQLSAKLFRSSNALSKAGSAVKMGGLFAGSLLIGAGAAKLSRSLAGNQNDSREVIVGAAASTLAFNARPVAKLLFQSGMYPKAAAQAAIKNAIPFISKYFIR